MKDLIEKIYDELNAQVVRMLEHSLNQASRIAELETKLQEQDAMLGRRPCINNRCMDMVSAQSRIADLERQLRNAKFAENLDAEDKAFFASLRAPSAPAVGKLIGIEDMCQILDAAHIKSTEYTDCTILYTVTFEQLRNLYMKGMASAPAADTDKVREALQDVIACFDAAEIEGLSIVLAETADERLKDLIERRVMHARYAAEEALTMAAQAPVREVPGWQPIETAPKDGSEVLLWLPAPYSRIAKARWFDLWENWQEGEFPSDQDEYCGIGSRLPTHYMPLPAAPVQQEGASNG